MFFFAFRGARSECRMLGQSAGHFARFCVCNETNLAKVSSSLSHTLCEVCTTANSQRPEIIYEVTQTQIQPKEKTEYIEAI